MTADARRQPAATPATIPLSRRLYGLGSLFGKTLRDSRRAIILVGGWIALLLLISGAAVAATWGTPETRAEAVALTTSLPAIFTGLYGGTQPNVETLGGFTNWRYAVLFFLMPGLWSLLALSSTLVTEARRGSMEFIAAGPHSRARVALEKLGGHVAAITIAMIVVAAVAWLVGVVFATLPGDEIPFGAALGYVLLMGLGGLVAGSIAFALAPFVGRGAAAAIGGAVLLGSWLINGYRESVPVFDALTPLSYFSWTAGHRPIAGTYDWPSLLPLVGIILVAGAVGVLAFVRRDLGQIGSVRTPSMPRWLIGVRGPFSRSFGERVTTAAVWGGFIALYGLVVASASADVRDVFVETPTLTRMLEAVFPEVDIADPGFALQLMFVQIGTIFIGLAAMALVSGWASDEGEGRLELLLTTPVARARWLVSSGLGVYLAIVVTTVVVAIGIGIGMAAIGEDAVTPMLGTSVFALYGLAMAGFGLAAGGLWRPAAAGVTVAVVVVASVMIDILAPILDLPQWVRDLALASHYGAPMIGSWDPIGIVASLALAIGGLAIGAWGFARRDLKG
jgi:ABC-2 type transport system permease protein